MKGGFSSKNISQRRQREHFNHSVQYSFIGKVDNT